MSQTFILDSLEVDKKFKGRLKADTKFNMAQIIFMQGRYKDGQLARLAITEDIVVCRLQFVRNNILICLRNAPTVHFMLRRQNIPGHTLGIVLQ